MSKRFRIAVVGCGDIAGFVALVCKSLARISISACVSKEKKDALAFAKKNQVPDVFDDYEELLQNKSSFDAVYLSTPHHLHAPMIRSAISLGIPILCEKPIAQDLDTAIEIVNDVEQLNGKVGINYQYRYNPYCQKLIAYAQHDIGQIHYVQINIPWHREPEYFHLSNWHKRIATAGGGTLLTQGSHFLDIALLAVNSKPISAAGITAQKVFNQSDIEIEDYAHAVITTQKGTHIEITSSMVAYPQQSATITIYGEKGQGSFSATERPYFLSRGSRPTNRQIQLPFGVHPLARSLQGFRNWIEFGQPYLTPINTALPVMAVIDAIYRSARSDQTEEIKEYE